jgi:hypothetical protein
MKTTLQHTIGRLSVISEQRTSTHATTKADQMIVKIHETIALLRTIHELAYRRGPTYFSVRSTSYEK